MFIHYVIRFQEKLQRIHDPQWVWNQKHGSFHFYEKKVDLRPPGSDNFEHVRPRCWHLWAIEFFFFMNMKIRSAYIIDTRESFTKSSRVIYKNLKNLKNKKYKEIT